MKRIAAVLITLALVAGLVGCPADPEPTPPFEYSLTVSSTAGGVVTAPGEDTFTYQEGAVVSLAAEAEEGYQFVGWSGDVGSVADPEAAETTVTMNGDYSITAGFQEVSAAVAVWDWHDLNSIRDDLAGHYVLMNDLDSSTPGYEELASPAANERMGWEPIGTALVDAIDLGDPHTFDPDDLYIRLAPFTGMFDGQGYEIRDLFIDRPYEQFVGLFGAVDEGGVIKNLAVVSIDVTGGLGVGGLVGVNVYEGTVSHCYSTGSVTGAMGVGGLVGAIGYEGTVSSSYSTADVEAMQGVGGLIGGIAYGGTVTESYATGTVRGEDAVGGLIGGIMGGAIVSSSYSRSIVLGGWSVGGLVGHNGEGTVSNCYARGHVFGDSNVGGLMGSSDGIINNCYAASSLPQALRHHGGLLDDNAGSVSNSFWDIERSRTERSDGGTGKTTAEMQDIVTFADKAWDIGAVAVGETDAAYVWNILPDETYPWLSWEEPVGIREIRTWHDLHAMRDNLDGSYVLMNDLDSATDGYAERAGPAANGGKGWEPIGDDGVAIDPRGRVLHVGLPFIGSFDGQGHRIRDLFIDRPDEHLVGLFGALEGSIKNVGIEDVAATGSVLVGGLAGGLIAGTVTNAYSTGSVSGDMAVGGLVGGVEQHGIVTNAHATCNVTGRAYVGGLVGANIGAVTHSHSGGGVTGDSGVGGLVGVNWDGTVNDSYSTATVAGETNAGGLVGENSGTVSNAFWDVEASGTEYSDGGTGKTAAEMKDLATFTDTATEGLDVPWDIVAVAPGEIDDAYVWNMVDGQTYPFLSWQSVS